MTFPAWNVFDADRRKKERHVRVYHWCRNNLDFCQVRSTKNETIADATGVHKTQVSRALSWLVTRGYLTEHPRGKYGERSFTLTYSRGVAPVATSDDAETPAIAA